MFSLKSRQLFALAPVIVVALLAPHLLSRARGQTAPPLPTGVSVADASLKILPSQGSFRDKSAHIYAARGEFEAFQVVLYGGEAGLRNVSVRATSLIGPNGAALGNKAMRLFREGYVTLSMPSNTEGGSGAWPDPLIPDVDETVGEKRTAFPLSVPARQNRVVWVEVFVPASTKAGTYKGTVDLLVQDGPSQTFSVPVQLDVWNFTLPATSSLRSFFGMGVNVISDAYCPGGQPDSYSACGGEAGLLKNKLDLARFLLDHRISSEAIYTGPDVLSSGNYDWKSWDALYQPLLSGTDPKSRLKGARLTSVKYNWIKAGSPGYFEKPPFYRAWADHARQNGWLDRTFQYTADEPSTSEQWNAIPPTSALAHGASPQFRTLVTTPLDQATTHGVTGDIDILCPLINLMDNKKGSPLGTLTGNQRASYNAFLSGKATRQLWMYQSCQSHGCGTGNSNSSYSTGWPSYMIDATAVQNRAMEWMSFIYGTQGELYYALDHKLPSAWTDQFFESGNGDGTLFYPGTRARIGGQTPVPVASIRLKMIREGMEDFEYLKRVSDLGDPDFARHTALKLFPHAWAARPSPTALMAARAALAQRILQLQG